MLNERGEQSSGYQISDERLFSIPFYLPSSLYMDMNDSSVMVIRNFSTVQ
jgi:hypothetical protein